MRDFVELFLRIFRFSAENSYQNLERRDDSPASPTVDTSALALQLISGIVASRHGQQPVNFYSYVVSRSNFHYEKNIFNQLLRIVYNDNCRLLFDKFPFF